MPPDRPERRRFFAELKRRKVFRVVAVYGAVAFGLIQVADPLASAFGLPSWFLPMVVAALLLGFPVAVVLAWALEVTPEGVRRTRPAEAGEVEEIAAQPTIRRWGSWVLALGGIAVLTAGAWFTGRQSVRATPEEAPVDPSIAVLPFADMSHEGDQEYFSDGISEELLNLLAGVPELRVAARTSSFAFRGEDVGIDSIARALGVAHVLEGSVRKSGDRIRVTAQLIRADDGFHMWSGTWDRTLDDVFAIQDEIAGDVVEQLRVTLLDEPPTVEETDPEAYARVLQGRHLSEQATRESIERAERLFLEAVAIDSAYAPAWSGLSRNYYRLGGLGAPWDSVAPLLLDAAERAVAADPEHALGHSLLGRYWQLGGDLAAAARHHRRALSLDPGDTRIVGAAAVTLMSLGRIRDALPLFEYAVARDPVALPGHVNRGLALLALRRPGDAAESFRTAHELSPATGAIPSVMGLALLLDGRPEAALDEVRREPVEYWRLFALVQVHHALGNEEESDAALRRLIEEYERDAAFNIAFALAYRGEVDRAFEWLERAAAYEDPGLSEILIFPQFEALEDDPRWADFLERIGKSPEDLAAVDFDVHLPR